MEIIHFLNLFLLWFLQKKTWRGSTRQTNKRRVSCFSSPLAFIRRNAFFSEVFPESEVYICSPLLSRFVPLFLYVFFCGALSVFPGDNYAGPLCRETYVHFGCVPFLSRLKASTGAQSPQLSKWTVSRCLAGPQIYSPLLSIRLTLKKKDRSFTFPKNGSGIGKEKWEEKTWEWGQDSKK